MNKAEFDRFADEYEAQHRQNIAITGEDPDYFARYKIVELARLVQAAGIEAGSILDFGSGIGNSIPHFRAGFPSAELACADVSPRSLEIAGVRYPGPQRSLLIEGDRIPLPDSSVDVTFTACVFHHIPHADHVRWLEEIRRVVKPGGIFAIFEHNPANPLTVRAVNTCPFDENAHLIWPRQMRRDMTAAGWADLSTTYHLFFPRILSSLRVLDPALRWLPVGGQYCVAARKR